MIPKLFEMVSSVSQACFALLQSPAHFAEHPDLVEERFYLASRFLDCVLVVVIFAVVGTHPPVGVDGAAGRTSQALRGVLHFCGGSARRRPCSRWKKWGDPLPPAMSSDEPLQARGRS